MSNFSICICITLGKFAIYIVISEGISGTHGDDWSAITQHRL